VRHPQQGKTQLPDVRHASGVGQVPVYKVLYRRCAQVDIGGQREEFLLRLVDLVKRKKNCQFINRL
jgi:hypothetical protein